MKRQTLQEQCLTELLKLSEANRTSLIAQSRNAGAYKNQERGKNRFDRKRYSKIANQVKSYNAINMNDFWKKDILQVNIPVVGETDEYTVTIKLEGVVTEIQKNIKNNSNKLEYRTIIQALTKVFNTTDVYAKCTCLTGDTKIKLLDGTTATIEDLVNRYNKGEKIYVYSVDSNGDFKPGEVSRAWQTGTTNKLIKVTLDNGKEIKTTSDHLYMLRDGTYARADVLEVGQSLMPLYTGVTKNGYETVKFNSTGKYHSTYKVVGEYYYPDRIEEKVAQAQQDKVNGKDKMRYDVAIHHKDFNKANNYPENLEIMTGYEHWLYHAGTVQRLWDNLDFRKAVSERSREWMTWLNQHPTEAMAKARHSQKNRAQITAHNYDTKWLKKHAIAMSEEDRKKKSIAALNRTKEEKQAHALKIRNTKMLRVFNKIIEEQKEFTAENYEYYRAQFFPKSPKLTTHFAAIEEAVSYFKLNHKIVAVEEVILEKAVPVYDITVDNFHNFAIEAGVILHNCDDFKYRFAHWNILKNVSVDDSASDPGPGKGIANPNDDKGRGCKHMLLVLANGDWMMKVASVINNYCHFLSEKKPEAFLKLVFPKLYGVPADEAAENDIVSDEEDLESGKDLIDIINDWAKNRGKFQKGSNINPVYANKLSKEQDKETKETSDNKASATKATEVSHEETEDKK